MQKLLVTAIALSFPLLSSVVVAREPDYPCYWQQSSGRIKDLTYLCRASVSSVDVGLSDDSLPGSGNKESDNNRSNKSGRVVLTGYNVSRINSKTWRAIARMRNDTPQTIRITEVFLRFSSGEESRVDVESNPLPQGQTVDFQLTFNKDPGEKINIDRVVWYWDDGTIGAYPPISSGSGSSGRCDYPDQIAADGKRCGGRAAEQ